MNHWDKAEKHARRAHELFELGQWSRAADELREALEVNPNQDDWHFGLAVTLDAMQNYSEAIEAYKQVIKIRGEDIDILLRMGIDQIKNNSPKQAVKTLARIEKIDSNFEPGYCYRIVAYTNIGDHDSAELMFYLAQQITDQCPHCYEHIAHSLIARGDTKRAIYCWEKTLELKPDNQQALINLARVYWENGELRKSREFFLKQLRVNPGHIPTLINLGNLLIEMRRYLEAKEKFRRALEIDSNLSIAHIRLGELSMAEGNFNNAKRRFELARLTGDKQQPGLHLGPAKMAQLSGDDGAAIAHLERELASKGHDPAQLIESTRMLIELGKINRAQQVITKLIDDLNKQSNRANYAVLSAALVCLGITEILKKDAQAGTQNLLKAARLDPRNSVACENLALIYLNENKLLRAKAWIKKTLALRPDDNKLKYLSRRIKRAIFINKLKKLFR